MFKRGSQFCRSAFEGKEGKNVVAWSRERGQMHLKNLCNNFFIREQQEWGSSMREDEPGAQGDQHRGRGPA